MKRLRIGPLVLSASGDEIKITRYRSLEFLLRQQEDLMHALAAPSRGMAMIAEQLQKEVDSLSRRS